MHLLVVLSALIWQGHWQNTCRVNSFVSLYSYYHIPFNREFSQHLLQPLVKNWLYGFYCSFHKMFGGDWAVIRTLYHFPLLCTTGIVYLIVYPFIISFRAPPDIVV